MTAVGPKFPCWLSRSSTPRGGSRREPGTQAFRDLDKNPGDETFPGIGVLRLHSGLFFATAQALEDRVRELVEAGAAPLRALVLDLEGVNFIDSQGAEQLAAMHELMESNGATLRLARVKPNVLAVLGADGFVARLGADRIHGNVHRASRRSCRTIPVKTKVRLPLVGHRWPRTAAMRWKGQAKTDEPPALNRGGHRQANAALYRAVIVRMRFHQPTIDYVARRTAEGKTKAEIIRDLKRYLAREAWPTCTPNATDRAKIKKQLDDY